MNIPNVINSQSTNQIHGARGVNIPNVINSQSTNQIHGARGVNIPNVINSQSTNQIHPSEIPRTTNFYVASSPDPPSPRVILDAIRAGVGLGLGPRLGQTLNTPLINHAPFQLRFIHLCPLAGLSLTLKRNHYHGVLHTVLHSFQHSYYITMYTGWDLCFLSACMQTSVSTSLLLCIQHTRTHA